MTATKAMAQDSPGLLSPNFRHLAKALPLLALHGVKAQRFVFEDPSAALFKLRQFGEVLAQETAATIGIYTASSEHQHDLLRRLRDAGVIDFEVAGLFHVLRQVGNRAVHDNVGTQRDALHCLRVAWKLGVWFQRAFKDASFKSGPFVPPPDPRDAEHTLTAELEQLRQTIAELQAQVVAAPKPAVDALIQQAQEAAENLDLSEAETRVLIDAQLREAKWEVDTVALSYPAGARPAKGRTLAIAEWPTNHPRALEAWYTPQGLQELLGQDIEKADAKLEADSSDYLPLRDYQHAAIKAAETAETAIAAGKQDMLLAMATGTGKTRTALCLGRNGWLTASVHCVGWNAGLT